MFFVTGDLQRFVRAVDIAFLVGLADAGGRPLLFTFLVSACMILTAGGVVLWYFYW